MKTLIDICRVVAVLGVVLLVRYGYADEVEKSAAETEKAVEASRMAWNKFLAANCKERVSTPKEIRKLMKGKYRDVGLVVHNTQTYGLLFLIDDFHQVKFSFEKKDDTLIIAPRVEPRGQWIRMPRGQVKSIPMPDEVRLKSKIAKVALDSVVKHTKRKRETLDILCYRSDKPKEWNAVVVFKTLQLSPPSWIFKITNDGVIIESPFEEK